MLLFKTLCKKRGHFKKELQRIIDTGNRVVNSPLPLVFIQVNIRLFRVKKTLFNCRNISLEANQFTVL
jgi:hypothetical protein